MATTESIEGMIGSLWYHYDVPSDVLYIRKADTRDTPTYGEESDDGLIMLSSIADDALIGITVVNWWKRSGHGQLPDSLREIGRNVEKTTSTLPIAA